MWKSNDKIRSNLWTGPSNRIMFYVKKRFLNYFWVKIATVLTTEPLIRCLIQIHSVFHPLFTKSRLELRMGQMIKHEICIDSIWPTWRSSWPCFQLQWFPLDEKLKTAISHSVRSSLGQYIRQFEHDKILSISYYHSALTRASHFGIFRFPALRWGTFSVLWSPVIKLD